LHENLWRIVAGVCLLIPGTVLLDGCVAGPVIASFYGARASGFSIYSLNMSVLETLPEPQVAVPASYATEVRTETLVLLFRQSFPAVFYSAIVALVLSWTLWTQVDTTSLQWWLAALGGSTLIRLGFFLQYFRVKPRGSAILRWELPFTVTLLLSSLVWGVGTAWITPMAYGVERGVVLFHLVGMAAGAMVTYSAHRTINILVMLAVLLPSTIWLYVQGDHTALGMAMSATLFMVISVKATKIMADAMQRSLQMRYELQHAHQEAEHMARTDPLTGIHNRRSFVELSEQTIRHGLRTGAPVSALLIDVDHFKQINDQHGHPVGDLVLKHLSALLAGRFRGSDVCGRIGGEEFAVLLADTSLDAAEFVAQQLGQSLAAMSIPTMTQPLKITVSIGVASGHYDLAILLRDADRAMYQAKAAGRNRVLRYQPVP